MISHGRTRAGLGTLLAFGLLATTLATHLAAAPAADAGATDPVLTSITLASSDTVRPGDVLRVAYSATDDGQSLDGIRVLYGDSVGRESTWALGSDLPLQGETGATVPQGLPNEGLQAAMVELTDSAGTTVGFRRDGSVCQDFHCAPERHAVDLSVLDVRVDGATPDNAVPVLTAVAAGTATVSVGGAAELLLTQDEANPAPPRTWWAGAVFRHSSGHQLHLKAWDGHDTLSGTVPDTVPNGTYVLHSVLTQDVVGNAAGYRADGSVSRVFSASTGPSRHALDFASTTITVTGATVDHLAPTLSAISYPRGLLQYGAKGEIGFTGTDDLSGISRISLEYTSSTLYPGAFTLAASVTGRGTAAGPMPVVNPGVWQLRRIAVWDGADHLRTYSADGTTSSSDGTGTHTIDFSALAVKVLGAPDEPGWSAPKPRSGAALVRWGPPAFDGGSAVLGYTVTVSPGGRTYSVGATARSLTVPGLTNDTKYTFAVRARNAVGSSRAQAHSATPRALQRIFGLYDAGNDGRADIIGVRRSTNDAYVFNGNGRGGIQAGVKVATGLSGVRALLPGVSRASESFFAGNVLAVSYDGRNEAWWAYNGNRLRPVNTLSHRTFQGYRQIVTPGDFTGNGRADIIGITDGGEMHLWAARSNQAPFYSRTRISGGWGAFTLVVGAGDLNGDRRNDLVARKKDGTLWLYAGNAAGGFRYARQIGASTAWKGFTQIAGIGDFNGDRRADLLALTPKGYLYLYKGNGAGGISGRSLVSTGFARFT